jgi:hypothetical protein
MWHNGNYGNTNLYFFHLSMNLPNDNLCEILGRLHGPDLAQCRLVCKLWRDLAPIKGLVVGNDAKIGPGKWPLGIISITYRPSGRIRRGNVPDLGPCRLRMLTISINTEYAWHATEFLKANQRALEDVKVLTTNYLFNANLMAMYLPNVTELRINGELLNLYGNLWATIADYGQLKAVMTIKGLDSALCWEHIDQLRRMGKKVIGSVYHTYEEGSLYHYQFGRAIEVSHALNARIREIMDMRPKAS